MSTSSPAKLRKSTRTKTLTAKAIANEIQLKTQKIWTNLRKYKRICENASESPDGITELIEEELEELLVQAEIDFEVLQMYDDHEVPEELREAIGRVRQGHDTLFADEEQQSAHHHESVRVGDDVTPNNKGSHTSLSSSKSASIVADEIESAELDITLQAREKQEQTEREIRDLETKLAALTSQLERSRLTLRKKQLDTRKSMLEEHGVDERGDIIQALENRPTAGRLKSHVSRPRDCESLHSSSSTHSHQSDLQFLGQTIAKAMRSSKLPAPEPSKFTGDPLEYVDWDVTFRTLIDSSDIADSDKMIYLKRYVGGPARECLSGYFLLNTPKAYENARAKLKERFGSDYAITEAFRDKLDSWPKIRNNDSVALVKFADFIDQCDTAMQQIEDLTILNDSKQNAFMMSKLPDWLANRWKREVVSYRKHTGKYPKFSKFAEFIRNEADIESDPVMSKVSRDTGQKYVKHEHRSKQPGSLTTSLLTNHNAASYSSKQARVSCLHCDKNNHSTADCNLLAKKSTDEKQSFVREKRLCFACLKPGHMSSQCRNKHTCKICEKCHPTVMHRKFVTTSKDTLESKMPVNENDEQKPTAATSRDATTKSPGLCSMVLPVWLSSNDNPGKEVLVYALLDSMSDTTFITETTASKLGARSKSTTLKLTTMTSENETLKCKLLENLHVRGLNSDISINITRAHTKSSIPLDRNHIPTPDVAGKWPHLQSIAHELPELLDIEVGMLIGYDNSQVMVPMETRIGPQPGDPFAIRTPLGWCVVGNNGTSNVVKSHICNRASTTAHVTPKQVIDLLQQDYKETSHDHSIDKVSQDDMIFMKTMQTMGHQRSDQFYSMPLPFKQRPKLPDNKDQALKRLNSLRTKLIRNETLRSDYMKFMNDMIDKGDAELVPYGTPKPGEQWYIPHFGVYHPKRKDKIRIVFDCSAKFNGTSLNDHLLQGPDMLNQLVGVLHRFRRGKVGVMCDIQRMFHMFKVHECDRNYLRFLWFKDESMSEIAEYRMTVHLFGATSSPACATYGLRTIAAEKHNPHDEHSVKAANFITDNFYVDDGLVSFDSVEEAVAVVTEATNICAKGNVRLHKFVSNDENVLKSIPCSELAETIKNLDLQAPNSKLPVERALGVHWCLQSDKFKFSANMKEQPYTRRGILSNIASVFDPLGFLSPFVLIGKNILQEMCKNGAQWDDPLEPTLAAKWKSWKDNLTSLHEISVPRCLVPPKLGQLKSTELHHFSDASNEGLGQCTYLRVVDIDNQVHCTLLSAKSRVAAMKPVTTPRAELQAAVLSIKMSNVLNAELGTTVTSEHFWTDSNVVLGYIQNHQRRFHTFVANRVQIILQGSKPSQWHYVKTTENPADLASRGTSIKTLANSHWFTGPKFLWNVDLDHMHVNERYDLQPNDPEVKMCHAVSAKSAASMSSKFDKFSDLRTAIRAICTLQTFVRHRSLSGTHKHTIQALEIARLQLLKWVQQDYLEEYSLIKSRQLSKNSALLKLDPFIDDQGLARVGGRLKHAALSYDEIHPIILPKQSHITTLIVRHCHEQVYHQGKNLTEAEIRSQGYWIIGCSSAVSSYIHACVTCRRQRRPTELQKISDLPAERVNPSPPFTYVGCDVFGPFVVRDGRKEIKRYGLVFTCLASRAIHIEMLDDMYTDSFINALRCLISIRGPVRMIRSDQGTNFIGAANEFKRIAENSKLQKYADENRIEFVTNVPSASHMGGVWERQIRTVRNVLNSMFSMHKARIDSSTLRTFLYEAMSIVNGRPLAVLSDCDTAAPLTPNQLLTMKSKLVAPLPGDFDSQDLYSRKRWRQVQSLANTFWSRWSKEYLQTLQVRQKWQTCKPNIQVGDIVLIKGENCHRNQWPIARVVKVMPSVDNLIRKVQVQLGNNQLDARGKPVAPPICIDRPIHKLVVLYSISDSNLERPSTCMGK